jgi:hypothetical protein
MTIKIDFEFETQHGKFSDALHLPDDHNFTEEEIQAMKEQRRDNWIAVITTSSTTESAAPDFIEIDGVRYIKAT